MVVPTSVVANWLDEARRFAPTLNALAYVGPGRSSMLDDPGPFDLIITTYALLHRDAEQLGAVAWHSAVLDEAQAIKNPATKRARAARALAARFRLVTTGTPVQNAVTDLYSLFSFINPGLLGSLEQFRRNFATSIEERRDDAARARLRRLVAPFILRRLKTEVLDDLPSRTEITLHVEMSPAEAAFYEALRRRAVEDLQSLAADAAGAGRLEILAHLTRLRRACCNPALVHPSAAPPSAKLAVFGETLAELLASRHKVLVFSQFVGHLKLIEAYLREAGISYQYLDGATSLAARRQRIAAFQAGQGDVFLISLTAGGVGLNLTAADYVIHMDPWWNPAVEDQASDRAHRIGQTRPVTIYRLVTKGTIEEQIVDLHHRKRDLAERLLEAGDAPARLDPSELLALLRQPLRLSGLRYAGADVPGLRAAGSAGDPCAVAHRSGRGGRHGRRASVHWSTGESRWRMTDRCRPPIRTTTGRRRRMACRSCGGRSCNAWPTPTRTTTWSWPSMSAGCAPPSTPPASTNWKRWWPTSRTAAAWRRASRPARRPPAAAPPAR